MKQIPTPEASTTPPFAIDWTKPVIEFDPWPFAEKSQRLKTDAWYITTTRASALREHYHDDSTTGYRLNLKDNVLGTAIDGSPFVTSPEGLAAWLAR